MGRVVLTGKGRRRLLGGHPWIYRDDVGQGEASPGELVPVFSPNAEPLGWGLFSSQSRIAVRMVSGDAAQPNRAFWAERMARAVAARRRMGYLDPEGACRLIHSDADGFPGWIVDLYGSVAVLQGTTQGTERMRPFLVELLVEALPFELTAVVDRGDASSRRLEGLPLRVELVSGAEPGPVPVREGELLYEVDVMTGHKTGHYLDQRENRLRAVRDVAGKRVLDAFSYDGLFGVRAALAGASEVLCLDQSEAAGARALRNAELNGVAGRVRFEKANAMRDLRRRAQEGERYDIVVCDPPAFAKNRKELDGAERGYVELNRRALELVAEGGLLVSASCSHLVTSELFLKFLTTASLAADRPVWLEERRGAALDHPWLLSVPESAYLECAFLRA